MNRERWERIQGLYEQALDLPDAERHAFLRKAAAGDEALIAEVMGLLSSVLPSGFVEPPAASGAGELFALGLDGRRLSDFVLLRELGRGGMGVVYLARQESLERDVAIKLLPVARRDPRALARFEREAKAASSLDHPRIVSILASGEEQGLAWYAMRYVAGHDLHEELRRQQAAARGAQSEIPLLPPFAGPDYVRATAALVADLAEALQAAHDGGVVHRDVKPQNVLLDERGHGHLVDFGLALDERFGSLTSADAIQGTPHYMSPEQARALRETVDHRTDVYSLSVVLYEMLTLRRPFEGRTSREILDQIGTATPAPVRKVNPRVPRDLAVICEKGMSKRPSQRYSSAGAQAADLRRFLRFEGIEARPPSPWERATAAVRRRRYPLLLGIGALAVMAAAAQFSAHRSRQAVFASDIRFFEDLRASSDWSGLEEDLIAARRRMAALQSEEGLPEELSRLIKELGDAFEQDRLARLASGRMQRDRGLGGAGVEGYGPYQRPASMEHLLRGLAELQTASLIYWDDAELARLADVEQVYPTLSVRLDPVSMQAPRASEAVAFLRAIDTLTAEPEETVPLGGLPIEGRRVPPGYYRVVVEIPGLGFSESTRELKLADKTCEVVARVLDDAHATAGMTRIEDATLHLEVSEIGCRCAGSEASVPAFLLDRTEVSNGAFVDFLKASGRSSPRFWKELGFDGTLYPFGLTAVWRKLPATGLSYSDAVAFAEWNGKRLPTHLELERAMRGPGMLQDPWEDVPEEAARSSNVGGASATDTKTAADSYRVYLENARPVDAQAYLQPPSDLFHAYGNVWELTETMMTVVAGQQLRVDPWTRVALGSAWDARRNGHTLASHSRRGIGENEMNSHVGFRCAKSIVP